MSGSFQQRLTQSSGQSLGLFNGAIQTDVPIDLEKSPYWIISLWADLSKQMRSIWLGQITSARLAGVCGRASGLQHVAGACLLVAGLVLIGGIAEWSAPGAVINEFADTLKTAHTLTGALIIFAFASCGVTLIGFGLEVVLGIEALHKFALAAIVLGPLSFATNSNPNPTRPAPSRTDGFAANQSEFQLGIYGGGNYTPPADVFLKQPNGTDMVLKGVPWTGEPFDDPPYYGVRGTYWTRPLPKFGVMLDFVHAKSISLRKRVVEQTGTRDGEPLPPKEPVAATFTKLEYSHGLNFLTLNAVYRLSGWHRRIVPYLGAGVGIMVPHTEIARTGVARQDWTYRYAISGPGFQALTGIEWRVFSSNRYAIFTEYKAGYAMISTELLEGGWVTANLWAHQAILGISALAYRPAMAEFK